jgi:hypothetical protein
MLKRRKISGSNTVKVSFILPADDSRLPASVVGDFNEWDPDADPMVRRSNGTFSAVVRLNRLPHRALILSPVVTNTRTH